MVGRGAWAALRLDDGRPVDMTVTLDPDAARAEAHDAVWRARLSASLGYLQEVLAGRGEDGAALETVRGRLDEGPVSPWVSCLYSRLVADVSRRPPAPADEALDALLRAADRPPAELRISALGDDALAPAWRAQFLRLIDTDRELPFRPVEPSPGDARACAEELAAARAIVERADPALLSELRALLREIVLGAPQSAEPRDDFGACSAFFLRELVLINAARRRSPIRMIDTLVHEASHVLLFGLAMEQPLTTDRGDTRLKSAAREDPRPIEGVFHAAFVMTRVHLAMSRMIASGRLTPAEAAEAAERRDRNGEVARDALGMVATHPSLTPLGAEIIAALEAYWAPAPAVALRA